MAKEILFIADDFGMDAETNRAILRAHTHGVLTGASLMMGQPATSQAIAMARDTPSLHVGIHLHFNDSQPCTRTDWPWGASPARTGWAIGLRPEARRLMRRELHEQWRRFQDTGLPCAFANSHHHLHWHPCIGRALRSTLRDTFSGWVRYGACRRFDADHCHRVRPGIAMLNGLIHHQRARCPFPTSDTLWGLDRLFTMNTRQIADVIRGLPSGKHELLFHPRRMHDDKDLECLIQLKRQLEPRVAF